MRHLLTFIFLSLLSIPLWADNVRVCLYSTNQISAINLSVDLGQYDLYGEGNILIEDAVSEGRSVSVRLEGKMLHVSVNEDDYGRFSKIDLRAKDSACILCLNPIGCKQRTYEGNLEVSATTKGRLLLVGIVDFETYIAGVVQSEIYGDKSDIFRIQAIISRTWAMRNGKKHNADGYNFCDGVHCQAYLNRCVRPDIMLGVIQSKGQTIVDKDGRLIDTPFHSNSGGQTANSEDVWRTALPYLRSVEDTFSYNMRQSNWVKTIDRQRWLNYFKTKHNINISDSNILDTLLHFSQSSRKVRIVGVPLTRIRVDFQLKSTFFDVSEDSKSNNIIISGHGYGHGVGLSQEGAIRMINLGIPYDSVIHHYYTDVDIYTDPTINSQDVASYIKHITTIIEQDKDKQTQVKSKKDDWLGRLFRLRDREEREEVYDESTQDKNTDWEYEW